MSNDIIATEYNIFWEEDYEENSSSDESVGSD
jgi:hypothetical protein